MSTGMGGLAAVLAVQVQARGIAKTNAGLATTQGRLEKTAVAGSRMGKAIAAGAKFAAAGTAVGLAAAVKVGMDFEKQLSSLRAVTSANHKEMRKLEDQALSLGESTAFTAREVALAQTELAKGGLSIEQIYGGGVQASLSLAAAGEMELGEAAETTVNAMKLFGLGGKDAVKIADMLATAANSTTADVVDFAMALKQGGSVARLAGLDLNETVTVLEALAETGVKNSDAGTSMKSFFLNIGTPSKEARESMEELNLSIFDQGGHLKALPAIAQNLRGSLGDLTEQEFLARTGTIAGSDAIRTLYALYDLGPGKLRKLEAANEKQGTAQETARKKMANFKGSLEQLQGAAETLGIRIFQLLKPSLQAATEGASDLVGEISEVFADKNLSGSQKFNKAFGLAFDRLLPAFEKVMVGTAEVAAENAPKTAVAFAKGFVNAGIWAKLATGAFIFAKMGGLGAFGKFGASAGRRFAAGFLLAVLGTELAKQVKQIVEGHKLDAPDSENFAKYLNDYFDVDTAKIVAPNRVRISTALGQILFNAQTQQVVGVSNKKLQGLVGQIPEQFIVKFQRMARLQGILRTALRPLPGIGGKAGSDLQQALLPKLDALVSSGGKRAEDFKNKVGGQFESLAVITQGSMESIGINVEQMLDNLNIPKPKGFNAGKALKQLPELTPSGGIKRQAGGIVPGTGSGDRPGFTGEVGAFVLNREATRAYGFDRGGTIPLALEPGERYFSRSEVRAMGGARKLDAINRSVPRFQKGGQIGHPQISGPTGPLLEIGQGAIDQVASAAEAYVNRHKPKTTATSGGVAGYTGPPANMKQLGDNAWVDSHTLAVAAYLGKKFGITTSSGYRSPGHNAAVGGVPNSFHTHGSSGNPGAIDFTPPSSAALNFATSHIAGLQEAMIHDVGSGLHLHLAFFQKGGLLQKLISGGSVADWDALAGTTWDNNELATLAHVAGMSSPGRMAQKAQGESSGRRKAVGHDSGGTEGLGLWQITTGFHDALIAKYGGREAMFNPYLNALAGKEILADEGMGAWYAPAVGPVGNVDGDLAKRMSAIAGGKGADGLSEGQKKAREGKARKASHERRLEALQKEVNSAQTAPAKQAKLWRLIKAWSRFGMFEQDEKGHILQSVAEAASQTKPQGAVNILQNLATYTKGHGEVTGQDPSNFRDFESAIERAQKRGLEQRAKAVERQKKKVAAIHARVGSKIAKRAAFEDLVAQLGQHRLGADKTEEYASQLVTLEPENVSDAYVGMERSAYGTELNQLLGWRNKVIGAQGFATGEIGRFEAQIAGIEALGVQDANIKTLAPGKKGAKGKAGIAGAANKSVAPDAYKKAAYKIPLLQQAITDAKTMRDETWAGELEEIQGLSGPGGILDSLPSEPTAGVFGGRIFEIQNSIRELGLKVNNVSDDGAREIKELEAQLNTDWHKRFLVSEAQRNTIADFTKIYPPGFAGMFATGGSIGAGQWGIAGETGKAEIVQGPARVYSPSESEALTAGGTSSTPLVIEELNVHDDGRVTYRYEGQEFEAAVMKVVRRGRATGRTTPGGAR